METKFFLNLLSEQRGRVNDANQFNIHFVSKLKQLWNDNYSSNSKSIFKELLWLDKCEFVFNKSKKMNFVFNEC